MYITYIGWALEGDLGRLSLLLLVLTSHTRNSIHGKRKKALIPLYQNSSEVMWNRMKSKISSSSRGGL